MLAKRAGRPLYDSTFEIAPFVGKLPFACVPIARGGVKHRLGRVLGLVLWKLNSSRRSIQIPVGTRIGYGLYIGHGGPIVVNQTATIGNNVNLSQFTTIGSNDGYAAQIGYNACIGPGVCIVENVRIGDNTTIGAGSVVTKDVPDNATAAGNYARVLNYNNPDRYVLQRWCVQEWDNYPTSLQWSITAGLEVAS